MIIDEEKYLAHYGILRKSGRYPWGSGGPETASNAGFLGMVEGFRKSGMSETEIARGLGISTTELRAAKSIASNAEKQAQIGQAQRLKDKGYSNVAIGQRMGLNESSVRALLAPGQKDKVDVLISTSNMLKDQVKEKKYLDVGVGVERHLDISRTKLDTAIARLKEEGYAVHSVQISQLGTNQKTTIKVLAPPGTTYSEVAANKTNIKSISAHSEDGGRSYLGIYPPLPISPHRVKVRYAEQGGATADGVIYVRPGVDDVSLGKSRYAQVRVQVGDSHYIKGMAMYKDDLPPGVDLVFNTNKHDTGNKTDAMKPLKTNNDGSIDSDNPFGATIKRQMTHDLPNGKKKVTSSMNLVNEEGDWDLWSKNLSSQVLSKQSPSLAKSQLDMTFERKQHELDTIRSMTNPTVRAKLLKEFAEGADSSAVHLKAAALPRQANHVILPIASVKENEIYAPNYNNGEKVVLIRHPHGGVFEIPELTVNNRRPEARKLLGNAKDAVGINHKVAQRLSGADFDGDAVLVIPNNHGKIKTQPALEGLKDFDPIHSYPPYEGMKRMTARTKAFAMGDISNLITDMTIRGANNAELARAVRHSMVVIDAEKHELNYKQSEIDNGIPALKTKYQGKPNAGASTLISRASSRLDVLDRRPRPSSKGGSIDKLTGKKVFEETGAKTIDSKGRPVFKKQRTTKLAEAEDAHTLSSGQVIEKIYADHSNKLKALANEARKEAVNTRAIQYSPSAKKAYVKEVASLDSKLNIALKNAPIERNAQVLANAIVTQKRRAKPDMEPEELKKLKNQALVEARIRTGASKTRIELTDSEWAAIQAGAISSSKLAKILDNANTARIKELAIPRTAVLMTDVKRRRAQAMLASGHTQAEVSQALGVSLTTLKNSLSE